MHLCIKVMGSELELDIVIMDHFIENVNKKREGAWRELYRRFYPALCNYALKIVKDTDVAEDVVQDCFIKIWDSSIRFEDGPSLTAYLYRAVYTRSLNLVRDQGYAQGLYEKWGEKVLEEQEEFDPVIEIAVEEDVVNRFYAIVDELSGQQKDVLLMSMNGDKVKEIAEKLQISENSVKTQKKRAYAYVRERLGEGWFIFLIFFVTRFLKSCVL